MIARQAANQSGQATSVGYNPAVARIDRQAILVRILEAGGPTMISRMKPLSQGGQEMTLQEMTLMEISGSRTPGNLMMDIMTSQIFNQDIGTVKPE